MANEIPIIVRRDLLGTSCLKCSAGTYKATGCYAETLSCGNCGSDIHRWLTKREIIVARSVFEASKCLSA